MRHAWKHVTDPAGLAARALPKPWMAHAVCAAACAGMTLAFYAGAVAPLQRERVELVRLEGELGAARERGEGLRAQLQRAITDAQRVQGKLSALPGQAVSPTLVNARIRGLTQLAEESGLAVASIEQGEMDATKRELRTLPITISGKGSFTALVEFLRGVGSSGGNRAFGDMEVGSLELRAVDDQGTRVLQYRVTLTWYSRPDTGSGVRAASEREGAGAGDAGGAGNTGSGAGAGGGDRAASASGSGT